MSTRPDRPSNPSQWLKDQWWRCTESYTDGATLPYKVTAKRSAVRFTVKAKTRLAAWNRAVDKAREFGVVRKGF